MFLDLTISSAISTALIFTFLIASLISFVKK